MKKRISATIDEDTDKILDKLLKDGTYRRMKDRLRQIFPGRMKTASRQFNLYVSATDY